MKDWPQALTAHKDRIHWCQNFGEVLLALQQAGVPPPDNIGAAHADWATMYGIFRVFLTLHGHIAVAGAKKADTMIEQPMPRHVAPEQLVSAVQLWAEVLNRIYVVDADSIQRRSSVVYALGPYEESQEATERLVEERNKPYAKR